LLPRLLSRLGCRLQTSQASVLGIQDSKSSSTMATSSIASYGISMLICYHLRDVWICTLIGLTLELPNPNLNACRYPYHSAAEFHDGDKITATLPENSWIMFLSQQTF
jgi:hypothetical protein